MLEKEEGLPLLRSLSGVPGTGLWFEELAAYPFEPGEGFFVFFGKVCGGFAPEQILAHLFESFFQDLVEGRFTLKLGGQFFGFFTSFIHGFDIASFAGDGSGIETGK